MKSFGERLKSARIMQGMTLDDLASKLDHTVSKQSLSKYEQGKMNPSSDVFFKICQALAVRPDYFTREIEVELEQVEFRKFTKAKEKEINSIKEKTKDLLERYFELEDLVNESIPFKNPITKPIKNASDIEEAAKELRAVWKLGSSPLTNVIEMMEENGVKVLEIEASEDFDGLSGWANGTPVIVLNITIVQGKTDRKRFTALHELAYLVLELPEDIEHKTKEKYCHRFAGAVLFPEDRFKEEFGMHRSHIIYKELMLLKEEWGMSAAAMIVRARDLDIISAHVYNNFWFQFAQYKKDEPGQYKGEEKSQRFEQLLLKALAEELISMSKAAALNNMRLAEFRDYLLKYD